MRENRDNIYIYLWEELNTVYIGRTVNPKGRHYAHKHRESEKTYQFSSEHHVEHPKMIIIENDLTIEEGVEREKYWIDYYRNNTPYNILNKTNGGEIGGQLSIEERKMLRAQKRVERLIIKSEERIGKMIHKELRRIKEKYKTNENNIIERNKKNSIFNLKVYYESHKEKIKSYQKQYRETHKEERKKYLSDNREKILLKKREYYKKYRETIFCPCTNT